MALKVVGITDYVEPPFDIEAGALGQEVEFVAFNTEHEEEFEAGALARLDALLVWHAHIGPGTLARLDRCRIVVRYGVGYDNIDLAAFRARGMPFCNTPDYGTEEVADTASAMILALQRQVFRYDFEARAYRSGWQENVIRTIRRTRECVLGIVGVGRIGTALIRRMRPFGYRILGYDPYVVSGHEKAISYERVDSLEELLSRSDAVSLHCNLTPETTGMISPTTIALIKDGAILVNTARGKIVESVDVLWDALRSNRLGGIGLDVLPDEPPSRHPLIDGWRSLNPDLAGRVIINPHSGYYSTSAWQEMRYKAAETIRLYLDRGVIRNRVV